MGYVQAAMAIFQGLQSYLGGKEAKEDAEYAANEEARLEGLVTDAKLETIKTEKRVMRGETLASAAGANVMIDRGSPLEILKEQARVFGNESRVVRQAGASRAAQAQTRGRNIGKQAMYAGLGNAAGSFGTAFALIQQQRGN